MAHLAIGDRSGALHWLGAAADKIRSHEPDPSAINLMNLKMSFMQDPVLEGSEFRRALEAICGD